MPRRYRTTAPLWLLLPGLLLLPAQPQAQAAGAKPPAPKPAAAKPPAAAPSKAAVPPAAAVPALTAEEQNDLKVRTLEERVSDLKEKVFRTKARLMNLQELVIGGDITTGAKAVLIHRNEMGSSFYLESVTYALDGAPIFSKVDTDGDLDKRESPGSHP